MGKVVRSGQPWQIADVRRDEEGFFWQQARDSGMRACLIVPLIVQGQPSGGLSIFSKQERVFEQEDVELAQAFGYQAAVALQNAQTLERERRAGRLARLLDESRGLPPGDRMHVERALATLERFVEIASQPAPGYARARLDGRWLQDSPIITMEPEPEPPGAPEGA